MTTKKKSETKKPETKKRKFPTTGSTIDAIKKRKEANRKALEMSKKKKATKTKKA